MRVVAGTTSLTDQVMQAVREAIHSGELRPGELYSVYRLAERLQVSRTPVREAMLRLAEAGMIRAFARASAPWPKTPTLRSRSRMTMPRS